MEGFLIQDASYTRLKRQADSAGRQGIYLAEYAENAERKMPFQDGRAKQFILFNAHSHRIAGTSWLAAINTLIIRNRG